MGWRWDGQRSSGRQFPFCWCVCVCVCGGEGGLVGHDKASNVALAAKSFTIICTIVKYSLPVSWYLLFLTKPLLHLVLNKAATIVLNRISSLHIVLFPHINICVVTKQMRDKTTRKVNTWPVTLKIYQVEGTVLVPIRIFVNKENTDRLKRWNVWSTCKAVNCFSNTARVKYSMATFHLHLHPHPLLLEAHFQPWCNAVVCFCFEPPLLFK